ncbi:MAG: tripartite tricarboxylate transporter TctB family protein [Deltaproteobacteria bacterium]|nr:tripartite tricarboxylate transporter TctB family protein [Deltaproteobacteria bacterium]
MVKLKSHIIFDLAVLLFFAFLVWEAKEWKLQARLYPWVIGFPMLILAVLQLGADLRGERKKSSGAAPVDIQFAKGIDPVLARERTIRIFSWIFGFLATIWLVGFPITIPTFVFLYLKMQAREGWFLSVLLTVVAWFIYWGLFERLLRLPMPDGKIFLWMGS